MIYRGLKIPKEGRWVEEIHCSKAKELTDNFLECVRHIASKVRIRSSEELANLLVASFLMLFDIEALKEFSNRIIEDLGSRGEIEATLKDLVKFKDFLKIPADTRPGANISSLVIHMLTTSAFSYCLSSNFAHHERQLLRVASLLHDIGKPYGILKHAEKGCEKVRVAFKGILDDKELNELCEIIRQHHEEETKLTELVKVLRKADSLSAQLDRAKELAIEVLKKELPDIDEKKFDEWKFWKAHEKDIAKLTEHYLKNCEQAYLNLRKEFKEEGEIRLAVIDVRKIKEYVDKSIKIPEIIGGSRIVSETVINAAFKIAKKISPECVLYFGGGNILFVAPKNDVDSIIKEVKSLFKERGLEIAYSSIKISPDLKVPFGIVFSYLQSKLGMAKHDLGKYEEKEIIEFQNLCDSCKRREERTEIEGVRYCDKCYSKFEKGRSERYKRIKELGIEKPSSVLEYLHEYLAGHDLAELEEGIKRRLDLSVVKADGNLVGEFLSRSISISELVEISMAIRSATDKAFNRILNEASPEDKIRIQLGEVYHDGDDFLLFVPGRWAIQAAYLLSKEFWEQMGRRLTLSVAIASFDPMFPVYIALDVVDGLLDDAKRKYREICEKRKDPWKFFMPDNPEIACINFEHVSAHSSSASVKSTLYDLRSRKLSRRPYVIYEGTSNKLDDFSALLKEIGIDLSVGVTPVKREVLAPIRDVLLRTISEFTYDERYFEDEYNRSLLFVLRQHGRATSEERARYWMSMIKLMQIIGNEGMRIIDAMVLLKLLAGGEL